MPVQPRQVQMLSVNSISVIWLAIHPESIISHNLDAMSWQAAIKTVPCLMMRVSLLDAE